MSSYRILKLISGALRQTLLTALAREEETFQGESRVPIRTTPNAELNVGNIELDNPGVVIDKGGAGNQISLWLYQVTENAFLKNQQVVRHNSPTSYPPLALNLSYLITPICTTPEASLMLIGFVMRVFNDSSVIYVEEPRPNGESFVEEIRVLLRSPTFEEQSRVWETTQKPYQLSLCYEVKVTRIDSRRVQSAAIVTGHDPTLNQSI